jgi:ABC-type transport system involved in Fe-S cluster assembly fused permease/ATPase subunit
VATVTQRSLRTAVGVVPQDTVLFNSTIEANVRYGRADATRDELEDAARGAQIKELIAGLELGWETVVGERGLRLSGGEKQRVAIARCLLKDPPIVLLDEATSALDSATEVAVQGALERLGSGRTQLVVAHRLSTIAGAMQILVLDAGRLVERGTHSQLLGQNGLYHSLWTAQQDQARAAHEGAIGSAAGSAAAAADEK